MFGDVIDFQRMSEDDSKVKPFWKTKGRRWSGGEKKNIVNPG